MARKSIIVIMLVCILGVLMSGCGSSSPMVDGSSTAPTSASPSTAPATVSPTQSSILSLKTEVYYFITNQRCVTCLCFESRIKIVIEKYYKEAISSGKMTFDIRNIQQSQNAALVKKYKAVGSQFFINTIINGVDHIKDIQEIWDWNCTKDPDGFMQNVRDVLDKSLKGQL